MSARGRIGRFVRGVAIHEFIRGRICTWQPELLVIKTRRSPFAPSSPTPSESEAKARGFQVVVAVTDNVRGGGDTSESSFIAVSAETRSLKRVRLFAPPPE